MLFSKEQVNYLKQVGLNVDFNNLTNDDYTDIVEAVADRLELYGFDIDYNPTKEGKMCEDIITLITTLPNWN